MFRSATNNQDVTAMNKLIALTLAAGIGFGSGAAIVGTRASAQDAPHGPPPGMMDGRGHGMMEGREHGMMGARPSGWMHRMREFALIYPAADRNLSGADVQKIAEAFLLLNGNHSWKVTEVTEEPNRVTFALATSDGGAIAHFAMDRHTGRPERIS